MGDADKALIEWRGQPLWQRQVNTLEELDPDSRWLLCRGEQRELWRLPEGWQVLEDEPGCEHPMQAVTRLIERLDNEQGPLLLLPVDVPRIDADWLRSRLLNHCSDGVGAVICRHGRFEPLVACYPLAILPLLKRQVAGGDYSWQKLIGDAVDRSLLEVVEVEPEESEMMLVNVNEPADWQRLQGSEVVPVRKLDLSAEGGRLVNDEVVVEGPLEIRLGAEPVAVVMRTPGHDEELAAGFLVSEGVISRRSDVFELSSCPSQRTGRACGTAAEEGAVIDVLLTRTDFDLKQLTRHVFASSSCGLCGKATIDAVLREQSPIPEGRRLQVRRDVLARLPEELRSAQSVFERTGGLHAAGLFDRHGSLLHLREDVGRHNAVDKLLGRLLLDDQLPGDELILMVSGRVSFEIMQKALAAGLPMVAAVSAPSSLAVDFANRSGQTLVGFLRNGRANVYGPGTGNRALTVG